MSLKRKRENEVDTVNEDSILNFLDENPYLYRSIQAIMFLKNNPPTNYREIVDKKSLYIYLSNFLKMLLNKFFVFNGNDITIIEDIITKDESNDKVRCSLMVDMGFENKLDSEGDSDNSELEINLGFFMTNIRSIFINFMSSFLDVNTLSVGVCSEGNCLWFRIWDDYSKF